MPGEHAEHARRATATTGPRTGVTRDSVPCRAFDFPTSSPCATPSSLHAPQHTSDSTSVGPVSAIACRVRAPEAQYYIFEIRSFALLPMYRSQTSHFYNMFPCPQTGPAAKDPQRAVKLQL